MSSQQRPSNPLLGDPSIIQVLKDDNKNTPSFTSNPVSSGGSIEPGSAFSKLLDSAIAKAAEESTPELEPRSNSSSPNTQPSPKQKEITTKNFDRVYTIELLLALRKLPFIKDYKETNELPDKSFWRAKSKSQNASSGVKEFGHNAKHSSNKNKSSFNKKRQDSSSNWERNAGFLKSPDLDSMSEDKISQLLGEPVEEIEPEWENADLNDELNINMGQTVEDFEKWKSSMRSEERRKNGEIVEEGSDLKAEKSGNEVDYFFSFVKPKTQSIDSTNSSLKTPNSGVSTPTVANSEPSAKSSRFSSFFNTPSSENHPQLARPDQNQPYLQAQQQQQMHAYQQMQAQHMQTRQMQARGQSKVSHSQQLPGKGDQGYSRFLSIISNPNEAPNPVQQPISRGKEGQPANNDTFFMSLMTKKDSTDGSDSPGAKQSPLASNAQPQIQPQMQQQQPSGSKQPLALRQSQQMNQQQHPPPPSLQLPPWMNQFRNGIDGPNLPGSPNRSPAGPSDSNQLPPNLPYPPSMGPPPKMFPPGFMPPPGMPMPSQFANGGNGLVPPPGGHPYMPFPPGMPPPPPGMGMPPVPQSNGFDQRNQPPARR